MRLKALRLKHFRCFKNETVINFDDLTAFIGKNDCGKSSILEALEIFFNDDVVKFELNDVCVDAEDREVVIGCIFDTLPIGITLDTVPTTPAEQYVLDEEGAFEIQKCFDCSGKTPKENKFIHALHPTVPNADDLLLLKNADLKKRADELDVDLEGVDKRRNAPIRKAIWEHIGDLQLKKIKIPVDVEDAKKVWSAVQEDFPSFALFQSDRTSNDEDKEVQDPLKLAIKEALKAVEEELEEVRKSVKTKATEVATRTLEKLKEMAPEIANELTPSFKKDQSWHTLFKLTFSSDRDIPINKRGSGVRRLILLNFFRAEAERKREEKNSPSIVYAFEEPETSQHPNHQKMLIQAFKDLSANENCQVIVTTHTPALAGMVEVEQLRYVENGEDGTSTVLIGNDNVYKDIADSLGVLPDINIDKVKALLCVEGINDVNFLKRISKCLNQKDNDIIDLETDQRVAFLPLGGSSLKEWVNSHYLKGLNLPEIHIYDLDDPDNPPYKNYVDQVIGRGDGSWATLTGKLEMENYLHPDAIKDGIDIDITFDDMENVPLLAARTIHESNSETPWDELTPEVKKDKEKRVKRRLNKEAADEMTVERLNESDPNGDIISWLRKTASIVK